MQDFDRLFRAADWKLRAPFATRINSTTIAPDWDKREAPREYRRQRVVMRTTECDYGLLGVAIENKSPAGVGFLSPISLPEGATIEIVTRTDSLRVEVVRCVRQGTDCYEVGGLVKDT